MPMCSLGTISASLDFPIWEEEGPKDVFFCEAASLEIRAEDVSSRKGDTCYRVPFITTVPGLRASVIPRPVNEGRNRHSFRVATRLGPKLPARGMRLLLASRNFGLWS